MSWGQSLRMEGLLQGLPSEYWGFVFANEGTRFHLAQHHVDLVCDFTCFGPRRSLPGPSGVWVG